MSWLHNKEKNKGLVLPISSSSSQDETVKTSCCSPGLLDTASAPVHACEPLARKATLPGAWRRTVSHLNFKLGVVNRCAVAGMQPVGVEDVKQAVMQRQA